MEQIPIASWQKRFFDWQTPKMIEKEKNSV